MRTFVYVGTSLDGFIAEKDGDIDWLGEFEGEEVRRAYRGFISKIDAVVIGRGTFEKVLTYRTWPYDKMVFVLSSSVTQIPGNLKGKVRILSLKPGEILAFLAKGGFSSISVDGGKVIQAFLREDCIDELVITRVPLLLGSGIPLFGDLDKDLKFDHIQTEVFSNGLVKSHYRRVRT